MTRYFTKDHEWIDVDGEVGTVGITDHAQAQLGDIVFVELPPMGARVARGGEAAVVESVKAASEVFAPLDGEVVEVNQAIVDQPVLVNGEPEAGAWFFKLRLSEPSQLDELMDRTAYDALIATQA